MTMFNENPETFRQQVRDMVRELQLSDAQRAGTATEADRDELAALRQKRAAEAQWERDILHVLTGRVSAATGS
jgi:hypothetical protein